MKKHIAYLKSLHACSGAIAYAEQYGNMQEAWEACRRPDWMLWLLSHVGHQDDRAYRRYACWCVRNTPLTDGRKVWDMLTDDRSKAAVAVTEQFADGEAGDQELAAAWAAAWASADAAYAAARAAAADAAYAAAYAAYAPADAAYAAAYAPDAAARVSARAAANAAYAAAWDAQSSYLREVFPWHVIESLMAQRKGECHGHQNRHN